MRDAVYWPIKEWQSASPQDEGMNPAKLEAIDALVKGTLPLTSSVLVIRHGYIVFERYYQGYKESMRPLYSM